MVAASSAEARMSMIDLDGASGFLVRAQDQRAGVLLLPTIGGVNKFVRDFAEDLAAGGLTTMVWDPYPGEALPASHEAALSRAGTLRDGPSLDAMSICVDHLMDELRCDTVGTVGFCLGGRYCLLLAACEARIGACSAVYPSIHMPKFANQDEDAIQRAGEVACAAQLIYPLRDRVTNNETFFRLQESLQRRPAAATMVQLYPEADHGFMHSPGENNAAAHRHARPLVKSFLETTLAPAK
jgi:carboxymethylenebutenolidase